MSSTQTVCICSYCNVSLKKNHSLECKNGHKYNCHVVCYKTLMCSIIKDDLQLDIDLIKCPIDDCQSYLYSIPIRSMENVLDNDIYSKAIDYWNMTYTGGRHTDDCGRILPDCQNDFDHHCEKIYNQKNSQQRILFATLGLKQRSDKLFIPRTYI